MIFSKEKRKRKQRDSLGKEVKRVSERFDFFLFSFSLYISQRKEKVKEMKLKRSL